VKNNSSPRAAAPGRFIELKGELGRREGDLGALESQFATLEDRAR
jgi:hypothetical protein